MTFRGELRPYQEAPAAFMRERGKVLCAAEQGTGKTILAIKVIEDLFDSGQITEPGIVVCLSTLKYQWADAIERFSDSTPLVIDGTPKQRALQYETAYDWWNSGIDYVILNYEQLSNEWDKVCALPRGFLVVDEASFIRGFRARRAKAVKKLAKGVPYRYALTGTPIENGRPEELYSIMEFVDPDLFGRFDLFDRAFVVRNSSGWVTRYRNIPTFRDTLDKAMVRLRSSDPGVREWMPETSDGAPMRIAMDPRTAAVYEIVAKDLLDDLDEAAKWGSSFDLGAHYGYGAKGSDPADRLRGSIGQKLMALQMLLDHPDLLRESARNHDAGTGGSEYAARLVASGALDKVTGSRKLTHTVTWAKEILSADERNKIVIFTRFVRMAQILHENLAGSEIYTGQLNAKQKDAALKRFQQSPECRVLVATDAGGFGLDIPQANYLLNVDLPDGAGLADQRDTRIVRTSSEFATVSRNWILTKNTIEERKFEVLNQKRAVAAAFLDARGLTDKGGVKLTVTTLTGFLRNN